MAAIRTPVFWDLHVHGVSGVDFMRADSAAMMHACETLGRNGIGYFAPTLLTAHPSELKSACQAWGPFLERVSKPGFLPKTAARPIGLHLEGPWLSPKMAGAHPPQSLKRPSIAFATDLIRSAQGHVSIVTMAPELPSALKLAQELQNKEIRVQMGHTTATASTASQAVRYGFAGVTHLYNAMRAHHRDAGPLGPLVKGLISAELITDCVHVSPDFIAWCLNAAGKHTYAVSDGCAATLARKGQTITLGPVRLRKEGAVAVVAATGTLAGGATLLTEHPKRLASALGPDYVSQHLGLFYRLQASIFRKLGFSQRRFNYFDRKTLRYLGCE